MPSLFNEYSGMLLMIMTACLIGGAILLYNADIWGAIPFMFGIMMLNGVKWPQEAKPTRVWLLTVFGQMTTTKIEGPTLVLDWIPKFNIIGYEEFVLKKVDRKIPLRKPVLCKDGVYVEGEISAAFLPDSEDDPPGHKDKRGEWKSGGEKLRDYANADDVEDIIDQLDDILTVWVQNFGNKWTSTDMEVKSQEMSAELLQCVTGTKGFAGEAGNSDIDDTRGLGIRFTKFQVILKAPQKVIDARVDIQVQGAKRMAEVVNTHTVNLQIAERAKMYTEGVRDQNGKQVLPPSPTMCPPVAKLRDMVFQENLEHDGKVSQVINQGGINVVESKVI